MSPAGFDAEHVPRRRFDGLQNHDARVPRHCLANARRKERQREPEDLGSPRRAERRCGPRILELFEV
ncbi:uncharacterized protein VDAG_05706 [Verticillium dahliae VdLs.17]|uniref:Uncharacterized protein n=1 Tax=Verticillium dahliae (strain VdLs.17 / ATCC MYA-4575 / FGSC 10137) TaxID=498257 RepID=G2X6C4_VERDV|nr:uncharacterized protein VDAG_05706 [Verticillium dahliae VdLs.17]EGY14542.1 hypothetical protein VDAG_05706 [Verticillium dahliae VdLs.17]PNH49900.1 hypothetical protein VD0003_g7272 [Verticillium dahliae]